MVLSVRSQGDSYTTAGSTDLVFPLGKLYQSVTNGAREAGHTLRVTYCITGVCASRTRTPSSHIWEIRRWPSRAGTFACHSHGRAAGSGLPHPATGTPPSRTAGPCNTTEGKGVAAAALMLIALIVFIAVAGETARAAAKSSGAFK